MSRKRPTPRLSRRSLTAQCPLPFRHYNLDPFEEWFARVFDNAVLSMGVANVNQSLEDAAINGR
jgi:hypothetical protein